MNSFIHQSLFFNEIDLAGIVVSDLSATLPETASIPREVMDHIQNREERALDMTEFRAQPLDWLSISGTMNMQKPMNICLRMRKVIPTRNI